MSKRAKLALAGQSVHFNRPLTNVVVKFKPADLVGDMIFKLFPVVNDSDVYAVMDFNLYDSPNSKRADGTESNPTDLGWKYVGYVCEENSLHTIITKKMRRNVSNQIDLESLKAELVKRQVLNNREKSIFGAGGLLRTAANNGYSVNASLTNPATDSPRTLVTDLINNVELNCGAKPNTLAAATDLIRYIVNTKEYKDETRFTRDTTNDEIPDQLYGLKVIPVGSTVNTANRGQSKKPNARLMGDDLWVGLVAEGEVLGNEIMSYGAELMSDESADMWYEKGRKCDVIEYSRSSCLKIVAKECGALATSVRT